MHILVTRPETEAARTTRQLEAMGHRVTLAPLLAIAFAAPALDLDGVQALLLTSRNAVHALRRHPQYEALRAIPVYAVGKSTAAAVRDAGFNVSLEGPAGGAELAECVVRDGQPQRGSLLHASGDAIAYDLESALAPAGFDVQRAIVYHSEPVSALPAAVRDSLRDGDLDAVLLMSPRTAQAWAHLVTASDLATQASKLVHLCLSPGVAAALAPLAPALVEIAVKPNEEQILALAARLTSWSPEST